MKLAKVLLTDRIPDIGTSALNEEMYELTFEGGLLHVRERSQVRGERFWLVPAARVVCMVPAKGEGKK